MDKTDDITYSKLLSALKKLHCLYWSDLEYLHPPGTLALALALAPALAPAWCSRPGQHQVT